MRVLGNIEHLLINGTEMIFNHVYRLVDFDRIKDEVLRHLVITRLSQPLSKKATVDYLKSYYNEDINLSKIARAREVMEYEMSTPNNDYWWWADGLYMAMPVMAKLYKITENELYLQKLYEYFSYAKQLMYDEEAGLFYRDAKYIYPKHKTSSGKKDFWSRGNGWVFAGLAKVLQDLPESDVHRNEYIKIFTSMAKALKSAQQTEGHWTRSILDIKQAPGFETSGTAFFTYDFLWGINHGLLDKKEYEEVIRRWLNRQSIFKNNHP